MIFLEFPHIEPEAYACQEYPGELRARYTPLYSEQDWARIHGRDILKALFPNGIENVEE